ncbi:lysine-specific demethylase 4D-like [Thrips palmi]|uniref:Lysine-specific demethylase 4D-like n=1 Tax=Thrips palmi TaxID=161013 RepID=A0A6P8YTW1_THRPL|nr:lysine-specific demethylase 4D-like [Thrips palmi]
MVEKDSGCGCANDREASQLDLLKGQCGVVYGSGILVTGTTLSMAPHFGLYAVAATSLLRYLPAKFDGVTAPMLYFGSTYSFFPAHVEDSSLFSVNYLHYGQPKVRCAAVSCEDPELCPRLRGTSSGHIPRIMQECVGTQVIQRAGEAVVVTPNAVHFGFNSGHNCAEAINFAIESWIPYGIVAEICNCL